MKLKTFAKGVHPEYHKELTSSKGIERAVLPKNVVIPLQQHAGAPCAPTVKKGDLVAEGDKIGDVEAFISAPIHASISGKVKDIDLYPHPVGAKVLSVVIQGDGEVRDWFGAGESVDIESLTPEAIRTAVREAGIVGMGGAGFPTSVKLTAPKGKKIDAVMLNGCECEPYLTADHRMMLEEADKVIWGLKVLMKAVGASKGYIGIEANKPDAIETIQKAIGGAPGIEVVALKTKYPQGAEKMLIKAALGRKVPTGKLPLDVGVVVNNVGTAAAVYDAIQYKKPLIERVVTISGEGIVEPRNLSVRIGTSFSEVIEQCGGIRKDGSEMAVLNGGPMMGMAQSVLDVPVLKGTSGITVLSAERLKPLKYDACIRCASCVEVCPMGLMPYRLGDYGLAQRLPEFNEWGAFSCIECGCCSYVCPSKRPLLQWIRLGKYRVRHEAKV
jgi:electron transport complex protein RnfC